MWKAALKYGPASVISIYLVYFLANVINSKIDILITEQKHSNTIHAQMLQAIKELGVRDVSFTQSKP